MEQSKQAYARLSLSETCDVLCRMAQSVRHAVILFHANPDGDAVGSAVALASLLTQMGMETCCRCADDVPGRLVFLTEGAAGRLLTGAAALAPDENDCAVISVDTASPAQLGALAEEWLPRVVLMIDHHATGTPYACGLIDPEAAATGELIHAIGQELLRRGVIDGISAHASTALYAAIASDTGSFRYTNVTERTFAAAAELRRSGVDTAAISRALFECKPLAQLRAEYLGFSVMQLWEGGRVAVIPFPYELKAANGLCDEQLETLTDVARQIEGVEIVLVIKQPTQDGIFRVSSRSSGDFCVSSLCARLGGGGHAKAAGCRIAAENMTAAVEQLRAALASELAEQG